MSSNEEKKIEAVLVLEILGRPPEHLNATLKSIIEDKMKKEKGVNVKNYKINEPVLMKGQKDFYTTFAEIELEVDNPFILCLLVFGYMPAHVEIINPEKINLTNEQFSGILNELTARLHGYDELARVMQIEKGILEKRLRTLLGEKGINPNSPKNPDKKKEVDSNSIIKKKK